MCSVFDMKMGVSLVVEMNDVVKILHFERDSLKNSILMSN